MLSWCVYNSNFIWVIRSICIIPMVFVNQLITGVAPSCSFLIINRDFYGIYHGHMEFLDLLRTRLTHVSGNKSNL